MTFYFSLRSLMSALLTSLMAAAAFAQATAITQPATDPSEMREYSLNGFELSGGEYWIFTAAKEFAYPDDVLWGMQGESTNAGAASGGAPALTQKCAMEAYNKLFAFLSAPPTKFVELKDKGATPRFYLWTNDYTQASAAEAVRPHKFWHWNRGTKDYSKGFWKWESTVARDGQCFVPDDAQISTMIDDIRTKMGL